MAAEATPRSDHPEELKSRYVLGTWLGKGARKDVYRGVDRVLNSDVAIALTKLGESERATARVTAWEAEVMGLLRSLPHVVAVFDWGEQDGYSFIVLQHMAGGTVGDLSSRARDNRVLLPVDQVITLGRQLAEGLAEIHAKGIVHRDIQPKNLWLDRPGGTLHLGDFDLAVRIGDATTALGDTLTNRSYMAPELTGENVASEASDLYSLGATLYEIATSHPPFSGTEAEVERKHRESLPTRPTSLRPDLPPALDNLIMRLLAKDPARRPASALEVREDLVALARAIAADPDLGELIAKGEGPHVEFKASFRTPTADPPSALDPDRHQEWLSKMRKELEAECMAGLAGFMNGDGGWLLVGVRDDGSVAGIEADYATMSRGRSDQPREDVWENHFRSAIKDSLGVHAALNITVGFIAHRDGTVAAVRCDAGTSPTWVKETDFFIRAGNRTQKVTPKAALDYAARRWPATARAPAGT